MKQPVLTIPPLANGDHLTPPEFERRYHAMAECIKAELIEGIVYMASPLQALSPWQTPCLYYGLVGSLLG